MLYFDSDKNEITEAEYNIRFSAGKKFGTWKFEKQPAMKQYSTARQVARELEEANAPTPESKATFIWKKQMRITDSNMPRHMEDLITDNPDFNIHEKMKTRYDEKVALRATQPKE
jgi:hypothetical protein